MQIPEEYSAAGLGLSMLHRCHFSAEGRLAKSQPFRECPSDYCFRAWALSLRYSARHCGCPRKSFHALNATRLRPGEKANGFHCHSALTRETNTMARCSARDGTTVAIKQGGDAYWSSTRVNCPSQRRVATWIYLGSLPLQTDERGMKTFKQQ